MIHGLDLAALKEEAKKLVQAHFVRIAETDGTQPTLRAMYVLKLQEARTVLAGGESEMISGEAAIRGITPLQMATVISDMAAQSAQLELARMQVNVRIEQAEAAKDIVSVLKEFDLKLQVQLVKAS